MGDIMGGGGAPDIPERDISDEWPQIKTLFKGNENQYRQFWKKKDPILRGLYSQARDYQRSPTSPLLTELQTQGLEQLKGGPSPLLTELQSQAGADLALGGEISPEEARDVEQQTRAGFAARGNVLGNQALGAELLNREKYQRERQGERRQFATGVEGLSEGDISRRFGLGMGVQGLSAQDVAQRFQLPESVLGTGTEAYTKLTNPLLAYASDLFSSNQNAAANEAIAGANKSSGTSSGIMSTIGSIAGAVGMAY
jgi:hypothetical protein